MDAVNLSVEFLAIPGAGKSAVSSRVVLILGERGFAVDDLSYRLAAEHRRWIRFLRKSVHLVKEVALHPSATIRAIRAIAAIRHPSLRVLGKMIFNWLLVSALARRGQSPGIHLYDQGIFQSFWSIGLEGGPDAVGEAAARLWGSVPSPDLVVVIEADLPAIFHRLNLRNERKSRVDRVYELQPQVLERCARILESTTKTLEAIRARDTSIGTVVLRCEDGDSLDRESRRLASLIESLLTQRVAKGAALVSERP